MKTYHFFPVTLLRTPSFSYKNYGERSLAEALKNDFFQNALLIASPAFYKELAKSNFELGALSIKARHSVQKYFNRICFRPTPFGMFSCFSAVDWGDETVISRNEEQLHLASGFADGVLAGQQYRQFLGKEKLQYRINQTVYTSGREFRFLVSFPKAQDKGWGFAIKSIDQLPVLTSLGDFLIAPRSYTDISDFLVTAEQITRDEAVGFLDELIDIQFLTDNLVPNIAGKDYMERLVDNGYPSRLLPIGKRIVLPVTPSKTDEVINDIIRTSSVALNDMYVNTEGKTTGYLSTDYQATILKAIRCLEVINGPAQPHRQLEAFKVAFDEKFSNRSLPLLHVLDPEVGIGYQNLTENDLADELTRDINWSTAPLQGTRTWFEQSGFFLKKWHDEATLQGGRLPVIKLQESDLSSFASGQPELKMPNTMSVIFRVSGDKIHLESAGGATGTALIGRFTPFNDKINAHALNIAGHEQQANPDVLFAEITHVCDFHTANINRRSAIYSYEIPVLTTATADADLQIPLADLYVTVINKEIILYSKKLDKRVIPRLSSALNYTRNDLAVFQFLGDMQHQGLTTGLQLDLVQYLPGLAYYPRVEYQNAILFLATWRLTKNDLQDVIALQGAHRQAYFKKIRRQLNLPRWVAYTVHDHQLVFDLNSKGDIELFLDTVRNQDSFLVKEYLYPQRHDDVVTTGTQPLINQFIASVYHHDQVYKGLKLSVDDESLVQRKLLPGSEWLYFKLYCHAARSNEILADSILMLIDELNQSGALDEWFFIRYADPGYHLRLRFKIKQNGFAGAVTLISRYLGQLIQDQKASHFLMDIYERELERYGQQKIDKFEQAFFESSKLTMHFINNNQQQETPLAYYNFGLLTVRNMLTCFELTHTERMDYLQQVYTAFFNEFSGDTQLKYQLDQKYRKLEQEINHDVLHEEQMLHNLGLTNLNSAFTLQLKQLYAMVKDQPRPMVNKWLADLIHMHLNRLFTDDSRKQEFALYHLLLKFEKAQQGRRKMAASLY